MCVHAHVRTHTHTAHGIHSLNRWLVFKINVLFPFLDSVTLSLTRNNVEEGGIPWLTVEGVNIRHKEEAWQKETDGHINMRVNRKSDLTVKAHGPPHMNQFLGELLPPKFPAVFTDSNPSRGPSLPIH